jgi:osmotically-inducible protein OsmY
LSNEPSYVAGHVHDALATDPRTGAQDVQATVVAGRVVLSGTCATDDRKAAITEVAREAARGLDVVNEVEVLDVAPPTTHEELHP